MRSIKLRLQHVIHVTTRSWMLRFMSIDSTVPEKTSFNIFFNPIWLLNQVTSQLFLNKIIQPTLREHFCEVSPRSVQPFWRRLFYSFRVNTIWLPNHVTYDVTCVTFVPSRKGGHTCKVSPQSVQPLRRRRFLKVKKTKKQIWLPNHVTDDVINVFFFFLWIILSHDDPQKCSYRQMWCSTYAIREIVRVRVREWDWEWERVRLRVRLRLRVRDSESEFESER